MLRSGSVPSLPESKLPTILKRRLATCSAPLGTKGWKVSLPRGRTAGTSSENGVGRGQSTG